MSDNQKTHFDLHVSGIGYLNRIREITPRKGPSFWACSINALRGDTKEVEHTYFDLIIRGEKALKRVQSLQQAVDKNQKVLVTFKLGDIYPEAFTYEHGEKQGQHGVSIKGRLLQIGHTTIDGITVDWADAGIPDDPPKNV